MCRFGAIGEVRVETIVGFSVIFLSGSRHSVYPIYSEIASNFPSV